MTRSAATSVQNSFIKGLITEASGLNFPENAVADSYDCVFNLDGSVEARPGFDFEEGYDTKAVTRSSSVINTFVWKDVAGDGDTTFLVVQLGGTLYFYDASDVTSVSVNALASSITLSGFSPSGAPSPDGYECQFSSGNGYLFVVHPFLETFYVSYDAGAGTLSSTQINLMIRDFEGAFPDGTTLIDERPTADVSTINVNHLYNIYNQGWTRLNLDVWDNGGSQFNDATGAYEPIAGRDDMPSNSDVMWSFTNQFDVFDLGTVSRRYRGNSPAPKGHFITSVYNSNRATNATSVHGSSVSGVTEYSTGTNRPSTVAFFSGRVWYAGLNFGKNASEIYFTQIIERTEQFGQCYQINDPTSRDAFDLLPTDGGVIRIQEAGSIFKLFATAGGLLVFATNGVWLITGSTGLGFTANDFSVNNISRVGALSHTSFVDIEGAPVWWNLDGIYMAAANGGSMQVQSLTLSTIQSFYDMIPPEQKKLARGAFNPVTGIIQWVYRSTEGDTLDHKYNSDRLLNYNVRTQTFYPWRPSSSTVNLHSIAVVGQQTTQNDATVRNKYLVTYVTGGSTVMTLANALDKTHWKDWYTYDTTGVDYDAYFVTGAKVHGDAIRKVEPIYLNVLSKADVATQYDLQTRWNYAVSADTGKWSQTQRISNTNLNYAYVPRRLKIRGTGIAFQYKIAQVSGYPFKIIGWSGFETGEAQP